MEDSELKNFFLWNLFVINEFFCLWLAETEYSIVKRDAFSNTLSMSSYKIKLASHLNDRHRIIIKMVFSKISTYSNIQIGSLLNKI